MKRVTLILLVMLASSAAYSQEIQKQITQIGGKARAFYLFVPDKLPKNQPVPLVLMLHGSGRNGFSLAEKWKDLAKKEAFILVAPDSINSQVWSTPADGPDFLHDLVTDLQSKYAIDPRRIYLFGHSGGACFALYMALYESEYFAAVAIHAGALGREAGPLVEQAARKIPIYIAVGTVDRSFPLPAVRATRDMLNEN